MDAARKQKDSQALKDMASGTLPPEARWTGAGPRPGRPKLADALWEEV